MKKFFPMLQTILIGTSWISFGYLLAKLYTKNIKFSLWCVSFGIQIIGVIFNGRTDLAYGIYGNPALYYLNGLLGTYIIIQAYQYIDKTKFAKAFTWFGKNTMVVLCTSSFVIEMMRLLDYKLLGTALPSLGFTEGIVLCSLIMIIEIVIILFCNKYFWFFLGKTRTADIA